MRLGSVSWPDSAAVIWVRSASRSAICCSICSLRRCRLRASRAASLSMAGDFAAGVGLGLLVGVGTLGVASVVELACSLAAR